MSSYDDVPLPTQVKKSNLTPEEEEEERVKQEIWEAVNKARQERHAKEEKERQEREAKRKKRKPRSPGSAKKRLNVLPDDDEASEKLLQQRKKLQEDRKRFAAMRANASRKTQEKPVDIIIASPKSSPKHKTVTRVQTPGKPSDDADTLERRESIKPISIPMNNDNTIDTNNHIQSPELSINNKNLSSDDSNEWKQKYEQLLNKYIAEQEGKTKMEQVLLQYENTINSLMSEQENSLSNINDSNSNSSNEEINKLKDINKELNSRLDSTLAELEAVSGDHEILANKYKDLQGNINIHKQTESQLRQQIQSLLYQIESNSKTNSGNEILEQSQKLERYRVAAGKQIEVLQLRFTKAESRISALQNELKAKTLENEKLTQISDSLIAMLESTNLE